MPVIPPPIAWRQGWGRGGWFGYEPFPVGSHAEHLIPSRGAISGGSDNLKVGDLDKGSRSLGMYP